MICVLDSIDKYKTIYDIEYGKIWGSGDGMVY